MAEQQIKQIVEKLAASLDEVRIPFVQEVKVVDGKLVFVVEIVVDGRTSEARELVFSHVTDVALEEDDGLGTCPKCGKN